MTSIIGCTEGMECGGEAVSWSDRLRNGRHEENQICHVHHGEMGSARDEGEIQADRPPAK
jgi:hypothetical protein